MGDYKSGYSTASSKTKSIASHNSGLKKAQSKAEARSHAYRENWEKVNLNDVVGKFAPGEKPYLDGNKLYSFSLSRVNSLYISSILSNR